MTDTNSVILDENSQSLINVNKNHQSTTSTIKSSKLNQINSNNTNDVNNNKTIKTSTLQSDQNSLHKNSTSTVHKPIEAFADLKWVRYSIGEEKKVCVLFIDILLYHQVYFYNSVSLSS